MQTLRTPSLHPHLVLLRCNRLKALFSVLYSSRFVDNATGWLAVSDVLLTLLVVTKFTTYLLHG